MEVKKSRNADIDKLKGTALLMGLVTALAIMYVAFQWSKGIEKLEGYVPADYEIDNEEIENTTRDEQEQPEPPKPEIKIEPQITEFTATDDEQTEHYDFSSEDDKPVEFTKTIDVPDEEPDDEGEIFMIVERQPSFPGGEAKLKKFLSDNLKYPVSCAEAGISGRVVCQFTVNKDGKIVDIKVLKSVHPDLDAEAIRVIKKMPAWTPGQQGGKNVRVRFNLPIKFKI